METLSWRFPLIVAALLMAAMLLAWGLPVQAFDGFVENKGQIDLAVKYYAVSSQVGLYFTQDAVVLDFRGPAVNLRPDTAESPGLADYRAGSIGMEPLGKGGCAVYIRFGDMGGPVAVEGRNEVSCRYNYFVGDDPSKWRSNARAYERIVYHEAWPGIDVVYWLDGGELRYELERSDGAGAGIVSFRCEGAARVVVRPDGSILAETPFGSMWEERATDGGRGAFSLRESVCEHLEDSSRLATEDKPSALLSSTFFAAERGYSIALDASGNSVVTGQTGSLGFPTVPGAYDTTYNGGQCDAFVAKLSASGTSLIWATFLGGTGSDGGNSVVLDSSGNVVLVGSTGSSDFPTTPGAYDSSYGGAADVFVTELSAAGDILMWSTFLGGDSTDVGRSLALDAGSNVVVTGNTASSDFPTTLDAHDTSYNGGSNDAFVAEISSSGDALVWSTFVGGSGDDRGASLAVDQSGDVLFAGNAGSSSFPTTSGAYDTSFNGGGGDAFLAKISASGDELLWCTFLGGSFYDYGTWVAVTPSGDAVVVGGAYSTDFPTTPAAYDTSFNGGSYDLFAARVSASGSELVWSTFLGGSSSDYVYSVALDAFDNAVLVGRTSSANFPTTPGAYDTSYNGETDAFVAKLSSTGNALLWSTFLGGASNYDQAISVALDGCGNPVVTGETCCFDFPTTPGAYDESWNGEFYDPFISRLDLNGNSGVEPGVAEGGQVRLYPSFPDPFVTSTTIRFYVPERQRVVIALYDVQGELVKVIHDSIVDPGRHQVQWNGETTSDLRAAPGIYFCRMETGEQARGTKVVLLD